LSGFENDRRLMLDVHLGKRGIRDPQVLASMATVPRELFVPSDLHEAAYEDRALPIGYGQTISQPYIVGLMAQSLKLAPDDTVLEVGSGSGYLAAVLARVARRVIGIEMVSALAEQARWRLRELGVTTVDIHVGDGRRGWSREAPYEAIAVSAAAPEVPVALIEQLAVGGRLVMPIGSEFGTQELTLIERRENRIDSRLLCPCKFVPLVGTGDDA
jgi:protein-L-isoaspartate(D-aspartate) O-methyltransferase